MAEFEMSVKPHLQAKYFRLQNPNPDNLLGRWLEILIEDNRRGVMLGLQGDDTPMPPVTYRDQGKSTPRSRKAAKTPAKIGPTILKDGVPVVSFLPMRHHSMVGFKPGYHVNIIGSKSTQGHQYDNLTTKEYKQLTGPPLAPRGEASRVITNYLVNQTTSSPWIVEGAWVDILSRKGVPFIHAHFIGAGCGKNMATQLPVRNLVGIRQWGRDQIQRALRDWIRDELLAQQGYFSSLGATA